MGLIAITLDQIRKEDNPRKIKATKADHSALVNSIKTVGLISPIAVRKNGDGYIIVAGARRFDALCEVCEPDHVIDCNLIEKGAEHIALAENVVRKDMHPIDVYRAVQSLATDEVSSVVISNTLGIPIKKVNQYKSLGSLHPMILKALEKDDIDLDVAQAYTLGNLDQQKEVFKSLKDSYNHSEYAVRSRLSDERVNASETLFKIADYEGDVIQDLFQDDVWLTDRLQCEELTQKAFDTEQKKILADGYKDCVMWVTKVMDWQAKEKFAVTNLLQDHKTLYEDVNHKEYTVVICCIDSRLSPTWYATISKADSKAIKSNTKTDADDDVVTEDRHPYLSHSLREDVQSVINIVASYDDLNIPTDDLIKMFHVKAEEQPWELFYNTRTYTDWATEEMADTIPVNEIVKHKAMRENPESDLRLKLASFVGNDLQSRTTPNLRMFWTPGYSFFSRMNKKQMLVVAKEAKILKQAVIEPMKKAEAAQFMADLFKNSKVKTVREWVPKW